jgi:type III pantothenate kinase
MRALLVVDVGNSETVVGRFADERLTGHWRLVSRPRTADEVVLQVGLMLGGGPAVHDGLPAVLCSVVPPATRDFAAALERLTGAPPVVVDEGAARVIPIRYRDPSAVGPDRIANAVAVRALHGVPAVVVDLGTATTFDVVGPRGDYLGGAIAPGVITSSEELFRRAARLSRIELTMPERAIGRTTQESLQAGILLGAVGMVDTLVRRIAKELGRRPKVVATGGLAPVIGPACETVDVVDEWLTLHGLRLLGEAMGRRRAAGGARGKALGGVRRRR